MNSGDWIENLTSLEYSEGKWSIYHYADDPVAQAVEINKKKQAKENAKTLMASLMQELNMKPHFPGTANDIPGTIEAA